MASRLVKGGTGEIILDALYDEIAGAYVNTATVTATVTDAAGTALPGVSALSLPYVTSSDGKYRAVVPASATAGVAVGDVVTATITATASGGAVMPFVQRVRIVGSGIPA